MFFQARTSCFLAALLAFFQAALNCLWGGVRVKGLASCEVAGRLCSWKCHLSFHSYQFTGYAFFGTFMLSEFLMGAVIKVFSE